MRGTAWGEFLIQSPIGSPAVRTRFYHQKTLREQKDPGESGWGGARCESGVNSTIAIMNKHHEGLKKDVRMDSQQDQMNLKDV